MEELADFIGRLERAKLQLKALQRTARTTLQVTTDLLEQAEELLSALQDAQPKEGTAHDYNGSRATVRT
jgi:hypothetical protein